MVKGKGKNKGLGASRLDEDTRANREAIIGKRQANNHYANQMFRPESTSPKGLPDAQSPLTHSFDTVLSRTITATNANETFSLQVWPAADSILGVSQGSITAPAGSNFISRNVFSGNDVGFTRAKQYFDTAASSWNSSMYNGQLAYSTTNVYRLFGSDGQLAAEEDGPGPYMEFVGAGAQFTGDTTGHITLPSAPGTIVMSAQVVYDGPASSAVTQGRLTINDSTGELVAATVNAAQTETYSLTYTGAVAQNTFYMTFRPNGVNGNIARQIRSITLNMNIANALITQPDYTWYADPYLGPYCEADTEEDGPICYRAVAQTAYLKPTSSSLNDGGSAAGVHQMLLTEPDSVPVYDYDWVASKRNHYPSSVKLGLWGFNNTSCTMQAREFQVYGSETFKGREFLVMAGVFATAGGSFTVEIRTHWEIITQNMLLAPVPSRVEPDEILMIEKMLEHVRCHFVCNPQHPVFQKMLAKAQSLWAAGKPYLPAIISAAKALAPIAGAVLAL